VIGSIAEAENESHVEQEESKNKDSELKTMKNIEVDHLKPELAISIISLSLAKNRQNLINSHFLDIGEKSW
jgi:hypothetical protein